MYRHILTYVCTHTHTPTQASQQAELDAQVASISEEEVESLIQSNEFRYAPIHT